MKLILAASRDGWFVRSRFDNMHWLGREDKAIFRALTSTDGGMCYAGRKTVALMPTELFGRTIITLHRSHLPCFKPEQPGWLFGGPTVAHAALDLNLITEAHICHSDRYAWPDITVTTSHLSHIYQWDIMEKHMREKGLMPVMTTMFGHQEVKHEVWRLR